MSKTFPSRPAIVRGRGRGTVQRTTQPATRNHGPGERVDMSVNGRGTGPRNTQATRLGRGEAEGMPSEETAQTGDTGESSQAQRISHAGAYTVIAPNERKRQEVMEIARRESENYNSYRQQKTPGSFNIVGTVGGGRMTESEARRKIVQESPTKLQRIQKVQQNKQTMRQREQEEIDKKKAEQRKKAEMNARKSESDQHKWDEDRRLKNAEYFNKLDQERNAKLAKTGMKGSMNRTASSEKETRAAPARPEPGTSHHVSNFPYTDNTGFRSCGADYMLSPEQDKRVTSLAVVFPQYSREELTEILKQVGFSVDDAIDLLQD